MSGVLANLTPSIVAACADAEASPSAEYLAARDLVPAMASKYADADDVASVARVILASAMVETNVTLSAGQAVKRAAAWCNADYAKADMPIGDTLTDDVPLDHLARTNYTAPDSIATWRESDTLEYVTSLFDDTERDVIGTLRGADVWITDKRGPTAGQVNVAALARARYGENVSGRAKQALSAVLSDLLADLRTAGRNLHRDVLPTFSTGWDVERGTLRDSAIPDSGPASAVVLTVKSGRWVTLADRSVRVTERGAAYALAQTDTLSAYGEAYRPASEALAATLSAPRDVLPARRPSGVSPGMVYGTTGQVAGQVVTDRKPAVSRKRKRDGGIGGPMTRG